MAKNEGKTTFILGAGAGLGLLLCSQLLKDGRTVLAMMSPGEESQYLKKNYPEAYHAYFQESMEPKAISEQIRKIIEEYPLSSSWDNMKQKLSELQDEFIQEAIKNN